MKKPASRAKKPSTKAKPGIEPTDLRMRFDTLCPILPDEPSDFIREITGTLNIFSEDDEEFNIPVGKVAAYKVELELAMKAKVSPMYVFDSRDDELVDYFSTLFDRDDFSEVVEQTLEPGMGPDLLIIDRVEIDPEFRGQNLGLIAALKTIETFAAGCAYVALRPWPLQFGPYRTQKEKLKRLKYESFEKVEAKARKKLQIYWSRIGFVQVQNTDVFILSPAFELGTSVAELCEST